MKQNPMKLGVLALLLLVISVCLATLGVLTFATAQADLRLSQRYAEMTTHQYRREALGQAFLRDVDLVLKSGGSPGQLEGVTQDGDVYEKVVDEGGGALRIGVRLTDGGYEIVRWETDAQWEPREEPGQLWGG